MRQELLNISYSVYVRNCAAFQNGAYSDKRANVLM